MDKAKRTEKIKEFINSQTTGNYTDEYSNGISYQLYTMNDGWVAIFEMHQYQGMIPITQANNRAHALSYIGLVEPVTIPMQKI